VTLYCFLFYCFYTYSILLTFCVFCLTLSYPFISYRSLHLCTNPIPPLLFLLLIFHSFIQSFINLMNSSLHLCNPIKSSNQSIFFHSFKSQVLMESKCLTRCVENAVTSDTYVRHLKTQYFKNLIIIKISVMCAHVTIINLQQKNLKTVYLFIRDIRILQILKLVFYSILVLRRNTGH
jgi:hypothetical protein